MTFLALYTYAPLMLLVPRQTPVATSYDSTGASWLLLFLWFQLLGTGKLPTQLSAIFHCGLQGHRQHAHFWPCFACSKQCNAKPYVVELD
jgi:hypothetical protein